jgi:hypothetical protein
VVMAAMTNWPRTPAAGFEVMLEFAKYLPPS